MRVLTWLPRDLREQLRVLDPAADQIHGEHRMTDRLPAPVAAGGSNRPGPTWPAHRRHGWALPSAAAAIVLITTVSVLLVSGWPNGSSKPATSGPTSYGAAAQWSSFPASADPRPVVLIGPETDGPAAGFQTTDAKNAFLDGRLQLGTTLPSSPTTMAGYPLIPATSAVQVLVTSQAGPATSTTLQITQVSLSSHAFTTDRGEQSLPTWQFQLTGAKSAVYVLAVAPAARYPQHGGDGTASSGPARLSSDGRAITIPFVASQPAGDCQAGYLSTLQVTETPTTVTLAVTVTETAHPNPSPGLVCPFVGPGSAPPSTIVDGAARTIVLAAPLGGRVVVGSAGLPYEVTSG